MTWPIRARLTAWYGLVVVAVLATSVVAVNVLQRRTALERLDQELERLMFTLEGVMRTEFGEGLTLQQAADEASLEVIAPDRALVLTRPDGQVLAVWGERLPAGWRPDVNRTVSDTRVVNGQRLRVFSHAVEFGSHRYVAAVLANLSHLDAEQSSLSRALILGAALALLVAVAGGWLVARQTLSPLTAMAEQATAISEYDLRQRLTAPNDRDELGQFASSFNSLLDRLATAFNAQRQFMADAAHELRTPVSVVRTTAQVTLAREGRPESEYREAVAVVAEQSARLSRLVDAMFLLARAEAQGMPLVREPLYLDDVLADSVRALRVLADQRQIAIATTGSADVTIAADQLMLRQLLTNLLDNAIRHARSRVTAAVRVEPGRLVLEIADDGAGVPADRRERIFERFVRFDPDAGGAGLGLPIARWIAEAHGGTLTIEGAAGSTFRFVLPIA